MVLPWEALHYSSTAGRFFTYITQQQVNAARCLNIGALPNPNVERKLIDHYCSRQ